MSIILAVRVISNPETVVIYFTCPIMILSPKVAHYQCDDIHANDMHGADSNWCRFDASPIWKSSDIELVRGFWRIGISSAAEAILHLQHHVRQIGYSHYLLTWHLGKLHVLNTLRRRWMQHTFICTANYYISDRFLDQ
jgi:hypothetical protein